jgi:nucleotide-binding universal stress UspA family protein
MTDEGARVSNDTRQDTWSVRRIAVATDLSPDSELALQRAARLAQTHGGSLTLVHVVPTGLWDGVPQRLAAVLMSNGLPTEDAVRRDAEEVLQTKADEIAAAHGIACSVRVTVGRTAAEIAAAARTLGADLLLVGAHGKHPVRDLLVGTTVQKLLRLSPCPVLVVKREPISDYTVVLAPTDLSETSQRAVAAAAQLLPRARLHLAHAFELPYDGLMRYSAVDAGAVAQYHAEARQRLLAELADWADAAAVPTSRRTLHVEHGYPPTRIGSWIDTTRAGLVVLAAHGKAPIDAAFIGSVSLHTALTAPCDVLLLRGNAVSRAN